MAKILAVGIATLDIINEVEGFPAEDAEVRAINQQLRRGGNASNTLVVLSQLGHQTSWAGVLANDANAGLVQSDLDNYGIDSHYCQRFGSGRTPTSYITLNRQNGSRTIVHYRDLPEYGYSGFQQISVDQFDWIHFEGRNIDACEKMLRLVAGKIPVSVEIEKPRDDIERLFPLSKLLLISRHYAQALGYRNAEEVLSRIQPLAPRADLVCSWGDQGAWLLTRDKQTFSTPAFVPETVVDTLAAGDTFNAGIIHARLQGLSWSESLSFASRLAGRKCGQWGLDGLA